jgi:glucose/arabinose dehydrogenase
MIAPPSLRRVGATLSLVIALTAAGSTWAWAQAQVPTDFADQQLVTMLDWPVGLAFLPDGRLITCELKSGWLRMIVNGELAAIDPIGAVDSVDASGEEEGLLSVAVDPRWPVKPFVYVLATALDSMMRISRFTATGELSDGTSGNLSIVPGSRRDLIRDVASMYELHNGGCLRFGSDSMLYASLGDDARACTAPDTSMLNGVVLRLDVRNLPDVPGPPNKALLVPADNPWAGSANMNQRLVYARGLRNPFRFHIDIPTGRLFVGDVGYRTVDEVDIVDAGGLNYGWPFFEGRTPFLTTECGTPAPIGWIGPVFAYNRAEYCPSPNPLDCAQAMIGGVVLRHVDHSSVSFPATYDGYFMFSDYYEGFIWMIRDSLGTWVRAPVVPGQPNSRDWARGYKQVTDYVLGPDGAVYYALTGIGYQTGSGGVRRIIHPNGPLGVDGRLDAGVEFAPIYPSPARGEATLRYVLPRSMPARLTLYDALGRRVRQLVPEGDQEAGEHRVHWDGADETERAVAPGVYLARLVVGNRVFMRRIPLVR